MRRGLWIFLAFAVAAAAQGQKLIWQDEFDGAAVSPPDGSKWTYDLGGGGWGNQELEVYTNSAENVQLDGDGHLIIRATRTADGAYHSARIKTLGHFSFTYGRAEARMKLPRAQGMWPAFWMLGDNIKDAGWPTSGEIDIMENIGREPNMVHGTIHGPGYSGAKGITSSFTFPEGSLPSDDYHVYAVQWARGKIEFLVDDKVYQTVTPSSLPQGAAWVYDHPFFLLLNLAVGGGWPGNPDATTRFPQELLVDWVRVYAMP
ncbi:MAG: glycoside hydrolase family 16 protein [Acidobacteriaceae bacterium]|nr:glycoside hydrolase family 16 protein [Acidobacteriaceae bacterium]